METIVEASSFENSDINCRLQLKAYAMVDVKPPGRYDGCIPVMVGVTPLSGTAEQRVPLDLVVVLHIQIDRIVPNNCWELLKQTVDVIVQKLDDKDRLAVLPVQSSLRTRWDADSTKRVLGDLQHIRSRMSLVTALESAESILYVREPKDKDRRAGHIIIISNSNDDTDSLLTWRLRSVHAFGFRDANNARTMHSISSICRGTYALLDDEYGGITKPFLACINGITSTVIVTPIEIKLKCNQEVVLSAIDTPSIYFISNDKKDGIVWPSAHIAGVTTNFVVYLGQLHHGDLTKLFTVHVKYVKYVKNSYGKYVKYVKLDKLNVVQVVKGMDGSKEVAEEIIRIKAVNIVTEIICKDWEQLHAAANYLSEQWSILSNSDCSKEAFGLRHGQISRLSTEMQEMEIRLYNNYYWLEYMLSWQSHQRCQLPLPIDPVMPLTISGKVPRTITGSILSKVKRAGLPRRAASLPDKRTLPLLVQVTTPEAGLAKVKRASVDLVAVLDVSHGAKEMERKIQEKLNQIRKEKEIADEHKHAKKMLEKPLKDYNKADKMLNKADEMLNKANETLNKADEMLKKEHKMLEELQTAAELEKKLLVAAEKKMQDLLSKFEEDMKKRQELHDKAKEDNQDMEEQNTDKSLEMNSMEKRITWLTKKVISMEDLTKKVISKEDLTKKVISKEDLTKKVISKEDLTKSVTEEEQEIEDQITQRRLEVQRLEEQITRKRLKVKRLEEQITRKRLKVENMEEQITQKRLEVTRLEAKSMGEQITQKRLEVKSMKQKIVEIQALINSKANEMNALHIKTMEMEQDLKRVIANTRIRLGLLIEAMDLFMKKLSDKDRLAIISVPFYLTEPTTGLLEMSKQGRSETSAKVKFLVDLIVRKLTMASANTGGAQNSHRGEQLKKVKKIMRNCLATNTYIPSPTPTERQGKASMSTHSADVDGCSKLGKALMGATKMLDDRQGEEKDRMGFIIVISDSDDDSICTETLMANYITHAFGFQDTHNTRALYHIARSSKGIYDILNPGSDKSTAAFMDCINKITSIIARDIKVDIQFSHTSSAALSKIDSGRYINSIKNRRTSSSILVDALYAGAAREFIIFMDNVPKEDYDRLSELLTVRVKWLHALSRTEEKIDCQVVVVRSEDEDNIIIYKEEEAKDCAHAEAVKIARVITDTNYNNRIAPDKLDKMRQECLRYAHNAGEDLLENEMIKMGSILRNVVINDNRNFKNMLANKLSYMFSWLSYKGTSNAEITIVSMDINCTVAKHFVDVAR